MKKILLSVFIFSIAMSFNSCGSDPDEDTTTTTTSTRCAAITKEGSRCKRTAEKGSIYCWQHK